MSNEMIESNLENSLNERNDNPYLKDIQLLEYDLETLEILKNREKELEELLASENQINEVNVREKLAHNRSHQSEILHIMEQRLPEIKNFLADEKSGLEEECKAVGGKNTKTQIEKRIKADQSEGRIPKMNLDEKREMVKKKLEEGKAYIGKLGGKLENVSAALTRLSSVEERFNDLNKKFVSESDTRINLEELDQQEKLNKISSDIENGIATITNLENQNKEAIQEKKNVINKRQGGKKNRRNDELGKLEEKKIKIQDESDKNIDLLRNALPEEERLLRERYEFLKNQKQTVPNLKKQEETLKALQSNLSNQFTYLKKDTSVERYLLLKEYEKLIKTLINDNNGQEPMIYGGKCSVNECNHIHTIKESKESFDMAKKIYDVLEGNEAYNDASFMIGVAVSKKLILVSISNISKSHSIESDDILYKYIHPLLQEYNNNVEIRMVKNKYSYVEEFVNSKIKNHDKILELGRKSKGAHSYNCASSKLIVGMYETYPNAK